MKTLKGWALYMTACLLSGMIYSSMPEQVRLIMYCFVSAWLLMGLVNEWEAKHGN